ncbi:MAG: hypothetical protein AAB296_03165, partial [Candidatus Desantisbacteria bacterium]
MNDWERCGMRVATVGAGLAPALCNRIAVWEWTTTMGVGCRAAETMVRGSTPLTIHPALPTYRPPLIT